MTAPDPGKDPAKGIWVADKQSGRLMCNPNDASYTVTPYGTTALPWTDGKAVITATEDPATGVVTVTLRKGNDTIGSAGVIINGTIELPPIVRGSTNLTFQVVKPNHINVITFCGGGM